MTLKGRKSSCNLVSCRLMAVWVIFLVLPFGTWAQHKMLLPIEVNNRWGFIDTTGKIIVEPQYDWCYSSIYEHGVSLVKREDGFYHIDTAGHIINQQPYDKLPRFPYPDSDTAEVKISVKRNGKWGYVNLRDEVVIPFVFDDAEKFTYHTAIVVRDGHKGYIDFNGVFYSVGRYDDVSYCGPGFIRLKKGGLYGLYDTQTQNVLLEPQFEELEYLDADRFLVLDPRLSRRMIINAKGQPLLLPPRKYYFTTSRDAPGLYILIDFSGTKKYGIMDSTGHWVEPPKLQYEHLYSFDSCGGEVLAEILIKDKEDHEYYGAINTRGEIVIPLIYEGLISRREGGFYFRLNGKEGIIDRNQKVIMPAVYDRLENCRNGILRIITEDPNGDEKAGYYSLNSGKVIWGPTR